MSASITDIQHYVSKSVLCWVASVDGDGMPNVSPKEIFDLFRDKQIIIANIASPQTVKNIIANGKAGVSFVDILSQKGYQVKGNARIVNTQDPEYAQMNEQLELMTKGKFPFATITVVDIDQVKPILAPSYILYPEDTDESQQIANAKKQYGLL